MKAWTAVIVAAAVLTMAVNGPIAQPSGYHDFADRAVLMAVSHAGDVLSNVGFGVVALWGVAALWSRRRDPRLENSWPGYIVFLGALGLTAFGSTFYHLAPDNARLVWDRLPIALACGGLLAAAQAETWHWRRWWLVGGYSAWAVLSVGWWRVTDLAGSGDLRPYLLLQGLPLVLIPLWHWAGGRPIGERRAFGAAVVLYVIAKGFELADHQVYAIAAPVSGHTLKHVCAALAASALVRGVTYRFGEATRTRASGTREDYNAALAPAGL